MTVHCNLVLTLLRLHLLHSHESLFSIEYVPFFFFFFFFKCQDLFRYLYLSVVSDEKKDHCMKTIVDGIQINDTFHAETCLRRWFYIILSNSLPLLSK